MLSKRCLGKVKGLSEAKVDKIKEAAAKIQVPINHALPFNSCIIGMRLRQCIRVFLPSEQGLQDQHRL